MPVDKKYAITNTAPGGYDGVFPTLADWADAIAPNYPVGNGLVAQDHKVIAEIFDDAGLTLEVNTRFFFYDCNRDTDHIVSIKAAPGHEYDPVTDTGAKVICRSADRFINRYAENTDAWSIEDIYIDSNAVIFRVSGAPNDLSIDRCVLDSTEVPSILLDPQQETPIKSFIKNSLIIGKRAYRVCEFVGLENTVCYIGDLAWTDQVVMYRCDVGNTVVFVEGDGAERWFYSCIELEPCASSSTDSVSPVTYMNIPGTVFVDKDAGDYHPTDGGTLNNNGGVANSVLDLDRSAWLAGDQNIGCYSTNGGGVGLVAKLNSLFLGQDF